MIPSVVSTQSPEVELRRLRKENCELQGHCEIQKTGWHLQLPLVDRYRAIEQMKTDHPITLLCDTLVVSRSGYQAWACDDNRRQARADGALRPKLHVIFSATRHCYGYPRMTVELRAQGERVGKTRFARLMRQEGLQGRQRDRFRPRATNSSHDGPIAPNRLAQTGPIPACDQVWQTDITCLPSRSGWFYLAVVIDAHSKRVLGCAFSSSLETGLAIAVLLMAIQRRGGGCSPGLLLNSDRGVQYASERFRAQLAIHGITASVSRGGNCYDNARAESFFFTLKTEQVYRHNFQDHDHVRRVVFG